MTSSGRSTIIGQHHAGWSLVSSDPSFVTRRGPDTCSLLTVQERQHRGHQGGRHKHLVMREVGKNRQAILRHMLALPPRVFQATAEQLIEPYDVFETNHIAVA